jgi:RimK family alpha-L-glutamate ligase
LRPVPSGGFSGRVRIGLVSGNPSSTTLTLAATRVSGLELVPMTPLEAATVLAPGDVALGRLDVRPTLDGVDDGLWALGVAAARGVTVLNGPATLIATHDKLLTARILRRAGLPHPLTRHVQDGRAAADLVPPVVLKPRHGSWGKHVVLCETEAELEGALDRIRREPWYLAHGAILQELVPPTGSDLRVVVAGDRMVGAVRRVAPPGEWRTNVALGAERVSVDPPLAAVQLAVAAARATSGSLVGVDLLPTPDGGFAILEVNGAVDFTHVYRPNGDIFRETALELARAALVEASNAHPASEDAVLT